MPVEMPEFMIIAVVAVGLLLIGYPATRILIRLGFPAALGLLSVIPLVNLALLWFVALSPWPLERTRP